MIYDVIILGAGLSGLSAARKLSKNNLNVLIIEADNRIGGRVNTIHLNEEYLDLGGQWLGNKHKQMYELVKEADLRTFPTYIKGKSIFYYQGKKKSFGQIPPLPFLSLIALLRLGSKFEKLAKTINLETPWTTPNKEILDAITVKDWVEKNAKNATAKEVFLDILPSLFCCEMHEISMFQALIAVKSGGSLMFMIENKNGAQEERIYGGALQICEHLLQTGKAEIILEAPVTHILQENKTVTITTHKGQFKAKKVISTIPLPSVKEIVFEPALPLAKQALVDNIFMAKVIKYNFIYDKTFWRNEKQNGISLKIGGYISGTFDNSLPESNKGIILAFVHANKAVELLTHNEEERKSLVAKEMQSILGEEAANYSFIHEYTYMHNPWIKGAYAALFPPTILAQYGIALKEPFQDIHWAGSETAVDYMGYMEGAVQSGQRAADEILKTMSTLHS